MTLEDSMAGVSYDGSFLGGSIGNLGVSDGGLPTLESNGASWYTNSGAQQLAGIGLGYLQKRVDLDIYSRQLQAQQPYLRTTQAPLIVNGQAGTATLNFGAMLPLLLIGGAVWLLAKA